MGEERLLYEYFASPTYRVHQMSVPLFGINLQSFIE